MNLKLALASVAAASLAVASYAITIAKGTPVTLIFDQSLSSKHAKEGQKVKLHVKDDVSSGGHVVIRHGTTVWATISGVDKRGRFGKNARLKLDIAPLHYMGVDIPLQPRQKGSLIGGTKGTEAAGAAGAGLLVLGPVGLAAGYFVVGKAVDVHPGQKLETEVARTVRTH